MSKLREIKRRIGSVNNIAQVTHAMQMVAASRMKKTQENAEQGKPYAKKIRELLLTISALETTGGGRDNESVSAPITLHPLINPIYSTSNKVLILLFSPQRGLAGSLPTNLLRFTVKHCNKLKKEGKEISFVVVGTKLVNSVLNLGFDIVADFSDMPETPTTADIRPLVQLIEEQYLSQMVGRVQILYPNYVNSMTQVPVVKDLIPFGLEELTRFKSSILEMDAAAETVASEKQTGYTPFVFEPSRYEIFDELVPSYLESQLYQAKLETVASEYSARMVAMKSASENAKSVKADLTLDFNKSRQAQITQEISEIVGGAEAS